MTTEINRHSNASLNTIKIIPQASVLANQYFATNYNQLLALKSQLTGKIAELYKQKNHLERTWTFCYFGSRAGTVCYSLMETLALFTSSFAIFLFGLINNNQTAFGVGCFGILICWSPMLCHCFIAPSKCTQLILDEHELIRENISTTQEKKRLVKALIKSSKYFAICCKRWDKLKASYHENHVKAVFSTLKKMKQEYTVTKIVGAPFLSVAPLFVMEKISQLFNKSQLAQKWQTLKGNPRKWETKNIKLWNMVEFPAPANASTYVSFLQHIKDKSQEADPSRWQNWFDNILKTKIEELQLEMV